MSNTEIAQFDLRVHAPSSLGTSFYEFDEPITVVLNVEPYELDLDIDPALTAEEPMSGEVPLSFDRTPARCARELGPGALLGNRYRIEKSVGIGGSAMLFSAHDLYGTYSSSAQEPRVALKVLHPELRHHQDRTQRLMREFSYMRQLVHPSIARVFDLQCDGGAWFMVLELLEGQSLSRYIARQAPAGVPLRQAIRILTECTEALICAHERGIRHGDLKPGNVIVDEQGSAHLIDFGAVPELDGEPQATLFATPAYASPQLLNQRIATARDDLFSLGCIAYELFTGRHPFGLLSSLEARRKALRPAYDERIPRELFDAICQLLAWEREARPADALEFLGSLAAVDLGRAVEAEEIADPVEDASASATETPVTEELQEDASDSQPSPDSEHVSPPEDLSTSQGLVAQELATPVPTTARRGLFAADMVRRVSSVARRQIGIWQSRIRSSIEMRRTHVEPESAPQMQYVRDAAPVAAVAGIAGLAFMLLHWSNAARLPYEPPAASPHEWLATLVASPIPLMEFAITVPEPSVISLSEPTPKPVIQRANGRVWLTATRVHVAAGQEMAVVNVRRDKSTAGVAPVAWTIVSGTAKPGIDFEMPKVRIARFNDGQEIRTLFVPLKPAKPGKPERRFKIRLQNTPQGPELGPITQTEVIIGAS